MPKVKRRELAAEATRQNLQQLARLGAELRASRRRRRMTQRDVGDLVGLAQTTVSAAELGRGGGLAMDTWQRLGMAVGRPLRVDLPRDPEEEPVDAGHLAIQELVLRTARAAGYARRFELATRPADPSRSADVGLINSRERQLVLIECVNTLGNLGDAARSSERKRAEADQLAAGMGRPEEGVGPYRVGVCWVMRDVRRNRELTRRYPEIFAARFPGSSARWLRALTTGSAPPAEPGLIWCDARATRLFARRIVHR
jgi:transcriptional regulator with XRE-family HTH domain